MNGPIGGFGEDRYLFRDGEQFAAGDFKDFLREVRLGQCVDGYSSDVFRGDRRHFAGAHGVVDDAFRPDGVAPLIRVGHERAGADEAAGQTGGADHVFLIFMELADSGIGKAREEGGEKNRPRTALRFGGGDELAEDAAVEGAVHEKDAFDARDRFRERLGCGEVSSRDFNLIGPIAEFRCVAGEDPDFMPFS